jgi:hypothetical protein
MPGRVAFLEARYGRRGSAERLGAIHIALDENSAALRFMPNYAMNAPA